MTSKKCCIQVQINNSSNNTASISASLSKEATTKVASTKKSSLLKAVDLEIGEVVKTTTTTTTPQQTLSVSSTSDLMSQALLNTFPMTQMPNSILNPFTMFTGTATASDELNLYRQSMFHLLAAQNPQQSSFSGLLGTNMLWTNYLKSLNYIQAFAAAQQQQQQSSLNTSPSSSTVSSASIDEANENKVRSNQNHSKQPEIRMSKKRDLNSITTSPKPSSDELNNEMPLDLSFKKFKSEVRILLILSYNQIT